MARKPSRMYRQIRGQAYTRRKYMGGVPATRITQFDLGNVTGEFPIVITVLAEEPCQIRHTALEACRRALNRYVEKKVGPANYHIKVRVYPHNVLRENKQATGAGADRVSMGMRAAFGKAVGTAARVSKGQPLLTIRTTKEGFPGMKEGLRRGRMKLPTPTRVVFEKGAELVM